MSESKSSSPSSSSATKSILEALESLRIEHESCKRNSFFLVEKADSMIQQQLADHKSATSERKRQLEKWLKLLEQWLRHLSEHFDRHNEFKESQENMIAERVEMELLQEQLAPVRSDIDDTNRELEEEVTGVICRLKLAIKIIANLENIEHDKKDRSVEEKSTAEDMSQPSNHIDGCVLHIPEIVSRVVGYSSFFDTVKHMRRVNKFWRNEVEFALTQNDELKKAIGVIGVLQEHKVLNTYVFVNKQYAQIILASPEQFGISIHDRLRLALTHDLVSAGIMAILSETEELDTNDFKEIMKLSPSLTLQAIRDYINLEETEKDSLDWLNIPLPEKKSQNEKLNYFYKYFDLAIASEWKLDFIKSMNTETAMQVLKHFSTRLTVEELRHLISTPEKLKIALLAQFESIVERVISFYENSVYQFWLEYRLDDSMKLVEDFVINHPTLSPTNKKEMAKRSNALAVKFLKESPDIFDLEALIGLLDCSETRACIVNNPTLVAKIPYRLDAKEKSDSDLGRRSKPSSWVDLMMCRNNDLATMMVKNQCRWFLDQLRASEVQMLIASYPMLTPDICTWFAEYSQHLPKSVHPDADERDAPVSLDALVDIVIAECLTKGSLPMRQEAICIEAMMFKLGSQLNDGQQDKIFDAIKDHPVLIRNLLDRSAGYLSEEDLQKLIAKRAGEWVQETLFILYKEISSFVTEPSEKLLSYTLSHLKAVRAVIFSQAAKKFSQDQLYTLAVAAEDNSEVVKYILESHAERIIDVDMQYKLLCLVPSHYKETINYLQSIKCLKLDDRHDLEHLPLRCVAAVQYQPIIDHIIQHIFANITSYKLSTSAVQTLETIQVLNSELIDTNVDIYLDWLKSHWNRNNHNILQAAFQSLPKTEINSLCISYLENLAPIIEQLPLEEKGSGQAMQSDLLRVHGQFSSTATTPAHQADSDKAEADLDEAEKNPFVLAFKRREGNG